jgi:tetratricopeptide (TPR) repeat protein
MKKRFAYAGVVDSAGSSSHRLLRATGCVLALLAGFGGSAIAGEDEAAQAQARAQRASAAYNLGNYAEAAREYETAYMATSDASLLVRIGEAWEAAGERQKALTVFRSCARLAPSDGERATCEERIKGLDQQAPGPATDAPLVGVVPLPGMATPPPPPAPLVVLPPPASTQAGSTADASAAPCPDCSSWPVWVAVGTAVVAAVVVGLLYFGQDNDLAMPQTTFGNKRFQAVRP